MADLRLPRGGFLSRGTGCETTYDTPGMKTDDVLGDI